MLQRRIIYRLPYSLGLSFLILGSTDSRLSTQNCSTAKQSLAAVRVTLKPLLRHFILVLLMNSKDRMSQ